MRDEVTITLRKDELRGIIVALTEHFDRTSNTFEEIAARYPILANGYDRLCEQARSANVPTLCDKSVNGGATMTRTEAERERRRAELVERPQGHARRGGGTLAKASALESIVLMQLIGKAAALNAELKAFAEAREMDCPTGGEA